MTDRSGGWMRFLIAIVLVLGLTFAVAACGDDDDDDGGAPAAQNGGGRSRG